jgi:multiple sugar transport system ATP-binding protein
MASVGLKGIRKRYDDGHEVIRGVDLEIADGEFMVFVGPSGCGKSTLLRMIAGLEAVTGGDLAIGGVRMNDVPPARRGVAMVFQSYALYPHLTVAENMGFALKMAGEEPAAIRAQVGRVAEVLQLTSLLDKRPSALSGGQRQRVAIGRAIVRQPGVFLFDEPLSNLDAGLRGQMRVELSRLHRELGTTMVYVTHDQTEAMTLGDRIAVFRGGVVEQVGRPMDLYRHPANRFVAGFLGSPQMNLAAAEPAADASAARLEVRGLGAWTLPAPLDPSILAQVAAVGVRPEHLQVLEAADPRPAWTLPVAAVERLGDTTLVHLQPRGTEAPWAVKLAGDPPVPTPGAPLRVAPQPGVLTLFDAAGVTLAQA